MNILKHSFQNFENVEYIVYSTCSIYPKENEEVVQQFLKFVEEENAKSEKKREVVLVDLHSMNENLNSGFSQATLDSNLVIEEENEIEEEKEGGEEVAKEEEKGEETVSVRTESCVRAYPFAEIHDGFFVALFKVNH